MVGTTKRGKAIVDLKRLVTGTLGLRGRKVRGGGLASISVTNNAALHRRRMVARIADWRSAVARALEVQRTTVMTDAQMKQAAATRPTTAAKIKRLLTSTSVATAGQVETLRELILSASAHLGLEADLCKAKEEEEGPPVRIVSDRDEAVEMLTAHLESWHGKRRRWWFSGLPIAADSDEGRDCYCHATSHSDRGRGDDDRGDGGHGHSN